MRSLSAGPILRTLVSWISCQWPRLTAPRPKGSHQLQDISFTVPHPQSTLRFTVDVSGALQWGTHLSSGIATDGGSPSYPGYMESLKAHPSTLAVPLLSGWAGAQARVCTCSPSGLGDLLLPCLCCGAFQGLPWLSMSLLKLQIGSNLVLAELPLQGNWSMSTCSG